MIPLFNPVKLLLIFKFTFTMNAGNNQYTASVYGLIKDGDYVEAVRILDVSYWEEW